MERAGIEDDFTVMAVTPAAMGHWFGRERRARLMWDGALLVAGSVVMCGLVALTAGWVWGFGQELPAVRSARHPVNDAVLGVIVLATVAMIGAGVLFGLLATRVGPLMRLSAPAAGGALFRLMTDPDPAPVAALAAVAGVEPARIEAAMQALGAVRLHGPPPALSLPESVRARIAGGA